MTDAPAPQIPGLEVWGRIGRGGMSDVWLAKHTTLATPVVIKTLDPRASVASDTDATDGGTEATARILSEARMMARVSDPRVVRALDAGRTADGRPYLVQEYVDGLDMAELDRRRRNALGLGLPLWLVAHVMREVCTGLRAAHQAGVIHRDVKPSNVFGATDSGIRLGDFGIATATPREEKRAAGTLKFMAPEQYTCGEIGRHTDVWGAGATACDLRYGNGPFESTRDLLDPNAQPHMPIPETPHEAYFQQTVRMMLARDLARRPQDIGPPLRAFGMLSRAIAPPPTRAARIAKDTFIAGPVRLRFIVGDIASADADAIVSSANYEMRMQSGVGAALRLRGGAQLEEEAMSGGERPLGTCIRTSPGGLSARHLFHAVSAWNEVSCVGRAFARALLLSSEHGCTSLAAPALGTGAARVSMEMCASGMITTLRWHIMLGGMRLRELSLYFDSQHKLDVFRDVAEEALHVDESRFVDLGLPVLGLPPSSQAATFLDPGADRTSES
ncbi:MAG: protein kinase [Myxococcales bacterium]|nr:protein kinase [Myxococcales bacterium]